MIAPCCRHTSSPRQPSAGWPLSDAERLATAPSRSRASRSLRSARSRLTCHSRPGSSPSRRLVAWPAGGGGPPASTRSTAARSAPTSARRTCARRDHRRSRVRRVRAAHPGRVHRFEGEAAGRAGPARAAARPRTAAGRPARRARRRAAPARPVAAGFDERLWLRRQGVHVVLQVDDWRVVGRRGGLGGLADRLRGWLRGTSAPGLGGGGGARDRGDRARRRPGPVARPARPLPPVRSLPPARRVGPERRAARRRGARRSPGCSGCRAWRGTSARSSRSARTCSRSGPQPSVIRAAVSGCAVSIAWLVARERDRGTCSRSPRSCCSAGARTCSSTPASSSRSPRSSRSSCSRRADRCVLEGYPVPRSSGRRSRSRLPARS